MALLVGKRVAFTGQLASMTRSEAAELVRADGGTFVTSVTRKTAALVIGQDGYPLRKDGTLSNKLEMAKRLHLEGCDVAIVTEEGFLQSLGLEDTSVGIHKRFTMAQLGRLLKVPRDRLRAWLRADLLRPVETAQGVAYFDFHQVTGIRTLWELSQAGVKTETIRQSLEQLTRWLPGADASLLQLNLIAPDGRLLTRLNDGQLADVTGQLHFDFEGQEADPALEALGVPASAEGLLEQGLALENAGQLAEAAKAYREALYIGGPEAKTCFNLGNVLHALDQPGQAAERFRQAVEMDHDFVAAWNNLGNVLLELGHNDDALDAFRHALAIQPSFADAHYNLADALEQADRFSEARRHWKEYLRLEQTGEWAEYARRRLAN